ncbi:phytanoyl-CoA hydroxylase-interacting protein-like isoform X1 [Saccostrea cucullata]|uniref:phytanoyl-CoA hydroxylase-interacting protein-like isoform X1 n=1 Tax=Saccostrea cuccullata TaxID=36930 RepID=UPI002ED4A347
MRFSGEKKMTDSQKYLTSYELKKLQDKCVNFIKASDSDKFLRLRYMWRDKPLDYWENILNEKDGQMVPYTKDCNGDQRSALNGNIAGLFFGCALYPKNGKPPWFSYLGNRRLYISSTAIFRKPVRLYFADFYCHTKNHFATLVLTKTDSKQDNFCRDHNLPQLDMKNNPFLKIQTINGVDEVFVTVGVRVEVLYTETIDVNEVTTGKYKTGRFVWVKPSGRGRSRPGGIPKNPACRICNL